MHYLIAGGGEFGTRYLRKLNIAHKRRGYPVESIVVIDQDPACKASKYIPHIPMAHLQVADLLQFGETVWQHKAEWQDSTWVPAPVAPHLIAQWIKDRIEAECGIELQPVRSPWTKFPLPFAKVLADGRILLSHAPGLCPVGCTEPANCAITGGARWWEMKDTISELLSALPNQDAVLHTAVLFGQHHYGTDAYGVGGIPMRVIYEEADRLVEVARGGKGRIGIATISSCHGVLNLFEIRPRTNAVDACVI
jgi:hypothetical protein